MESRKQRLETVEERAAANVAELERIYERIYENRLASVLQGELIKSAAGGASSEQIRVGAEFSKEILGCDS